MKKILLTVAGLIILAGGAFAMSDVMGRGEYLYKITVNVETPDGIKSSSAVRKFTIQQQPQILPQVTSSAGVKGEAVVIDLGEDKKIFALISSDSYYELLSSFSAMGGAFTDEGMAKLDSFKVGEKRELTDKYYWPQFVIFDDLSNPMSVKAVNKENVSEQLGAGYTIQNIMIQITDEDIEWNIVSLLPWLKEIGGGYIHGGNTSRNAPLGLHGGNFIRGNKNEF